MRRTLPLLWSSGGLVIANKPRGVLSTGRDLSDPDCAQAMVRAQLDERRLWAVHQLDKETSGLNLFVTRKSLVQVWASRLAAPETTKTYLAVVASRWLPEAETQRVDTPIGTRRVGRKTFPAVGSDAQETRPAHSRVHRMASNLDAALVAVEIATGRTHQVRLHLASLGMPVWGDELHGRGPSPQGMALHAWRLRVEPAALQRFQPPAGARDVPTNGGAFEVTAPLPSSFVRLLDERRLPFSPDSR